MRNVWRVFFARAFDVFYAWLKNHMFLYHFCHSVSGGTSFNMVWRTLLERNSWIFEMQYFLLSAIEREICFLVKIGPFVAPTSRQGFVRSRFVLPCVLFVGQKMPRTFSMLHRFQRRATRFPNLECSRRASLRVWILSGFGRVGFPFPWGCAILAGMLARKVIRSAGKSAGRNI